jgi:hypothetical protein
VIKTLYQNVNNIQIKR